VAQFAVYSPINTKQINTVWAECTVVKLVVQHVTSGLYKDNVDMVTVVVGGNIANLVEEQCNY
jgi:hypothetical protein